MHKKDLLKQFIRILQSKVLQNTELSYLLRRNVLDVCSEKLVLVKHNQCLTAAGFTYCESRNENVCVTCKLTVTGCECVLLSLAWY